MSHENRIFSTVQRLDGGWRVVVENDGLEHTHETAFAWKNDAFDLRDEILEGLGEDEDLNLRLWSSKALA